MAVPRSSMLNPPILRPALVLHLLFEVLSTVPGDSGETLQVYIICWRNVMITNSWLKSFTLPFLGSDLIFSAENLLRNHPIKHVGQIASKSRICFQDPYEVVSRLNEGKWGSAWGHSYKFQNAHAFIPVRSWKISIQLAMLHKKR